MESPDSLLDALLLAIIQGITEFLPVSSSGHLVLVALFQGMDTNTLNLAIALHAGTLLAVVYYLRSALGQLLAGCVSGDKAAWRQIKHLALATAPLVLVGSLAYSRVEALLHGIVVIALVNAVFAAWLWYADKSCQSRLNANIPTASGTFPSTDRQAFLIGLAQCFAIFPGASRSGVVMTAAMLAGADRTSAARFSLLLSIPAITGSGVLALSSSASAIPLWPTIVGVLVAASVAFAAIHAMMRLIVKTGYKPFIWYRLGLSLVLLVGWLFLSGAPS